jgi:heterodisulfide reductase subunit A-like polyferredoxin
MTNKRGTSITNAKHGSVLVIGGGIEGIQS